MAAEDRVFTHMVGDPAHPGLAALAFDYPASWRAESQLVWNLRNQNGPALIFARAGDPAGPAMWQLFPNQDCYLLAGGMGMAPGFGADPFGGAGQLLAGLFGGGPAPGAARQGPPTGFAPPGPYHVDLGGVFYGPEQGPPMTPDLALPRYLIPKFRGHMPDLRILSVTRVPELGPQLGDGQLATVPHDGAMARIAYTLRGTAVEEQFLCGGYCLPPNGNQQNWGLRPIMSFRAARGELDALMQRHAWIAQSVRPNPAFLDLVAQLQNRMHAGQQAAMWGQQQDYLANQAREMEQRAAYFDWHQRSQTELQAQSWQSFNNRVEGFGDAMMGRTAYVDPSSWSGQPHYDYGHHAHVWTDGRGNFQHADDPNYDPNVGSDRRWMRADKPLNR